jgi:hypothetical protein
MGGTLEKEKEKEMEMENDSIDWELMQLMKWQVTGQNNNFSCPRKVSGVTRTLKMVLAMLAAAAVSVKATMAAVVILTMETLPTVVIG